MRKLGNDYNSVKLVQESDKYTQRFFTTIYETRSENFLRLNFEELVYIIESDQLYVPSERIIFELCMKWVKFDESRLSKLPKLLAYVRLPMLDPQYIIQRVQPEHLIKTSLECRDLIDEAKDYHLLPTYRESIKYTPRCQKRRYGGSYITFK